jgi:hypothetical protein
MALFAVKGESGSKLSGGGTDQFGVFGEVRERALERGTHNICSIPQSIFHAAQTSNQILKKNQITLCGNNKWNYFFLRTNDESQM